MILGPRSMDFKLLVVEVVVRAVAEDMKKNTEEESVVIRRKTLKHEPVYLRGWDWKRHKQRGSGRDIREWKRAGSTCHKILRRKVFDREDTSLLLLLDRLRKVTNKLKSFSGLT